MVAGVVGVLLTVTACDSDDAAGSGPGACLSRDDGRSVCIGPDGASMTDGEGGRVEFGRDGGSITGDGGSVEFDAPAG